MANTKQAKFIIDVSAEKKRVTESSVRFFSYDSKTAEIIIQAEKEDQLISKSIVSNVEIFFESVDASFQPTDKLKWKDQMTVVADGLFSYLLPDELLNYQGLVAFEIYINYTNNDKSDSSYRIVYAQRSSAIDRAAGEIELVYIKDFEALKKEVADKAAEVKESLAGYDSGLDIYADQKKTEMDAFSTSVGNLASAEKLKIQAELPTVKQVNVDETKKIKAEYPIVEQVATTEKEKIRAVLSTVDQTASEVSAYADRKISEYDAKFTQSNQKMNDLQQSQTALTTKLTETQQKITDSDVFTKQESSDNVIYQLIGKEKVRITLTLDFKNKIAGSDIENPNAASARSSTTLLSPSSFTLDGNVNYPKLGSLDGETLNVNGNWITGFQIQMLSKFNILETLKRELGERFFISQGAESIESQIALIKKILVSSTYHVWGYGSNPNGNKLSVVWWMDSQQYDQGVSANNTNTIREITRTLISASPRTISDDGCSYVLAYADPSDGSTTTSLSIDYSSLDIELEISANDYFTSVIAAYNRTLLTQLNDLAGRVSALESN